MRVRGLLIVAAMLAAWGVSGAVAQDNAAASGESTAQMPEVGQNRRPAEDEQTGLMSGSKPFSLTVDPSGEMIYNFGQETRELESVTAKKGAVFTSEDMTLNADQIDYKAKTSELVATGKRVVVRQGEMVLTCQLFRYFPETQRSEFSGNPMIYNKTADGKVQTLTGGLITIDMVDGRPQVRTTSPNGNVRPGMRSGGLAEPGLVQPPAAVQGKARIVSTQGAPPAADATSGKESETTGSALVPIPILDLGQKKE